MAIKKHTELPIQQLIRVITDKRIEYISKYGEFPNSIQLNKQMLMELKLFYLSLINIDIDDIKTIYGMKIQLTDNIESINDIYVWYEKELSV